MHYLTIQNVIPGMVVGKPIMGDNGSVLVNAQSKLTETVLKRLIDMGYQGTYVETPVFQDVEIDDIITYDLRTKAFQALRDNKINDSIHLAKEIVKELKYKKTLKLDLLDIKSDKNYIFKHSISVAVYAVVVGMHMELTEEQLESLAVAGVLHDIGILEINEHVQYSRNKFSESDMDEMKKHPIIAFELLQENPGLSSITRNAILFHHENLDGSGYYQIPEDQIGILPRILRVVDVYDSMTAEKQYRHAMMPGEILEYIMGNVGTLFDKTVVDVFVKHFPMYPVGFTVRLTNNEPAVVISNEESPLRPKVRLFKGKEINLFSDPEYRSVMIKEIL